MAKDDFKKRENRKLTTKQQRFVEVFNGNWLESTALAGYSKKSVRPIAAALAKDPKIIKAIHEKEAKLIQPLVMKAAELQEWWSKIVKDDDGEGEMKDRLRASDLLGKSKAMFSEIKKHEFPQGLPNIKISGVKPGKK